MFMDESTGPVPVAPQMPESCHGDRWRRALQTWPNYVLTTAKDGTPLWGDAVHAAFCPVQAPCIPDGKPCLLGCISWMDTSPFYLLAPDLFEACLTGLQDVPIFHTAGWIKVLPS